jgi:hypothetical protein
MSKTLWIAQRFMLNERGHYTVAGHCGGERIMVEIDPSVVSEQEGQPERQLVKIKAQIQAAARQKWEAGEAHSVINTYSGQIRHHVIALTAGDLRA